jgi:protein-S-isoprenylcysteine O-methyltransferase Ste14
MYTGLWFTDEPLFYCVLLLSSLGIALSVFIMLFFVTAGYGRHTKKRWGPRMNTHLGWFIMEIPTVLVILICFILSDKTTSITHYVFIMIWFAHYTHRVFIYPFTIRNGKKITLTVVLMGFVFNLVNAYIQARWLFTLSEPIYKESLLFPISNATYNTSWLYSPQFIIGAIIFAFGYFINKQSDHILRNLRKPTDEDDTYKIPHGGLYKHLSCPNYLGEILEWIGWAVLTWSIAGLYFALWTIANLLPRAISNHKWYKENFEDYPEKRKAIIPFLL